MGKQVILFTSNPEFGETQHRTLEQYGGFEVFRAETAGRTLQISQARSPFLIILDAASLDQPPKAFRQALSMRRPDIRLLVVLPEAGEDGSLVEMLRPEVVIRQPLAPQELLLKVLDLQQGNPQISSASNGSSQTAENVKAAGSPPSAENLPFPWLEDIDLAAQHLTQLSLESAANAALIVNKDRLYAYAGEFTYPGASALAKTVWQHWHRRRGSDLVQFVKLDDGNEYMMYATHLVDELVLALIFDAQMPFSKIRSQANRLAHDLSGGRSFPNEAPSSGLESGHEPQAGDSGPLWVPPLEAVAQPAPDTRDTFVGLEEVPQLENLEKTDPSSDWQPANLAEEIAAETEEVIDPFSGLDIPADWQPTSGIADGPKSFLQDLLDEALPAVQFPYEERPANTASDDKPASSNPGSKSHPMRPILPNPESMDETRPTSVPPERNPVLDLPEPEDYSYVRATYAFVVVPRLPHHHLVREIAKILEDRIPQICLSFDWRLEHLSIRPEYMQWMAEIRSSTAPGYHVRTITQLTSNKIFYHLPRLADENPSGEFWAPGQLMVTSDKPLHPKMVLEFIQKTRKRQGLL